MKPEDINIPDIPPNTIQQFSPRQILQYLNKFKTNKATIPGDIPAQIVKWYSKALCIPMSHMINHNIRTGSWPDPYKAKLITPFGKETPVEVLKQLRPISNMTWSYRI